jgi:protein-S-isoprenylcysteine O-methyltransferase Ste14
VNCGTRALSLWRRRTAAASRGTWRVPASRYPSRTLEPSTAIVSTGVYRFTRNPMYLAMALIYVALAMALDSGVALLLLAPLLLAIQHAVILREERYLERKFGEDYLRYKRSVRRWF